MRFCIVLSVFLCTGYFVMVPLYLGGVSGVASFITTDKQLQ